MSYRPARTSAARSVALVLAAAAAACSDSPLAPTGAMPPSAAPAVAAPVDGAALDLTLGVAPSAAPAAPELPRAYVTVPDEVPTGRTIRVPVGRLQAALDTARAGDRLLLTPGATYRGNFRLRRRFTSGWVVVETEGAIVPPGQRAGPEHAARMAKIVPAVAMAAIQVDTGAQGWRIQQVEVSGGSELSGTTTLVAVGRGQSPQTTAASAPRRIVIDRSYIHGSPRFWTRRCVALNGADVALANSYVDECHHVREDAQAVLAYNAPGPTRITNNYLAGSGENIMLGGGVPGIRSLTSADVQIDRNFIHKPLGWKGTWMVKNLLELKAAERVLIENNVFDGSWVDGQQGYAMLMKTSDEAPNLVVQDVTTRRNLVRNATGGVGVSSTTGRATRRASRLRFEQNVFDRIGEYAGTSTRRMFLILGRVRDLAFEHNTAVPNAEGGATFVFDGGAGLENFLVRDNVLVRPARGYTMVGTGAGEGTRALENRALQYTFTGNMLVNINAGLYPAGNVSAPTLDAVGFVDPAAGDWRFATTSPFWGRATDGSNPGANITRLRAAVADVE